MKKLGELLKHIIVPLVTAFTRDTQEIDFKATEKLIEHLISKDYCDSILVAGTTGEFNTLLYDERVELFKFVKKVVAGRRPLLAGTGAASTKETVILTKKAEELGYDVAMVVAPYYCKPTQEGIFMHFKTIAQGTSLPIMLYNIPLFTGVNIDPLTVGRLAEFKNILGIKDETGLNPTQMTEYARATPDHFTIYNGDDIMVLCGMVQGAAGVVSGGSHMIGDKMRKMIELFLAGKVKEAEKIHKDLDPLFKSWSPIGGVNPIPGLKAAIELMGIQVGPPRLPLVESTKEEKELIKEQLMRLGLFN
jgi:4-hydroxy-tetrahydrodipicolinate synthase